MVDAYIVTLDVDYGGSYIAVIFNNLEDAKKWIEGVYRNKESEFSGFDGYSIYKRTLGANAIKYDYPAAVFMPDYSKDWKTRTNEPWKWIYNGRISD